MRIPRMTTWRVRIAVAIIAVDLAYIQGSIAPTASRAEHDTRSTVNVDCRLDGPSAELKPEMTGHARIACGRRPIGRILAERLLGFLRTEFWLERGGGLRRDNERVNAL